jgi:hypothetical protein
MAMSVDLDELLERVTDEQSFIDFVAAAWAMATSRNAQADAAVSNVWQRCATILLAGKFYE